VAWVLISHETKLKNTELFYVKFYATDVRGKHIENRVLRTISEQQQQLWRELHNEEFHSSCDIVSIIDLGMK
jgi:hypothetical protein